MAERKQQPDNFDDILGVTNYLSDEFWHVDETDDKISIVPIGDVRSVVLLGMGMLACFVVVFIPIVLLTKDKAPAPLFVAGFFASCVLIGLVTYAFWYNVSLGPWLSIDRAHREVQFPRLRKRCRIEEIVAWQIVSGRTRNAEGRLDVTELNAIVNAADGNIARWPVIGGYYTRTENAIRELAQLLHEMTNIPIRTP